MCICRNEWCNFISTDSIDVMICCDMKDFWRIHENTKISRATTEIISSVNTSRRWSIFFRKKCSATEVELIYWDDRDDSNENVWDDQYQRHEKCSHQHVWIHSEWNWHDDMMVFIEQSEEKTIVINQLCQLKLFSNWQID